MKIITHSGNFHPDEVFGVAALRIFFGKEAVKDIEIIRTRDLKIIEGKNQEDIVLDVGFKYISEENRYDHHQEGGAGKRENGVPYASFGLIWKHFGERIAGSKRGADTIEEKLVLAIDAGDNGVDTFQKVSKHFKPYLIEGAIISFLPTWQEKDMDIDGAFMNAVALAQVLLKREISKAKAFIDGESAVEKAYQDAQDKRIIMLDNNYSWRDVLVKYPEPLFVIMNDGKQTTWAVSAIRKDGASFQSRKLFPESWAGKSGSAFAEASGVSDANFCHNGRFIVVANSKEGALKLANLGVNT
jgi:uncharacterized UPF0160 family protein